ncbi:Hsp20/alpha crystallin family protein [Haloarchaeobius sp. DFWS5]|uniref:Hsp20/alpha crystallin family protein n=1 Tax=Haloarchaeobius sp. DFWS5 TaxID=3446114 RepID=UPI003EBD9CC9
MAFNRFDDMNRVFDDMNRMFEQMRAGRMGMTPEYDGRYDDETDSGRNWLGMRGYDRSGMSLTEDEGCYVCVLDMPGYEKSDIDCTYEDGMLYVSAERAAAESADNVWMRSARRMSERVSIPREIVSDDISATYRNGVLEVRMPLVEAESRRSGRSIDIN